MEVEKELKFLQELLATSDKCNNNKKNLDEITQIIRTASCIKNAVSKQTVLNMGFRAYYKILYKYNLRDIHFENVIDEIASEGNAFEILQAVLLSERGKKIETKAIKEICLNALNADNVNNATANSNLLIIKNLNILLRKDPSLDVDMHLSKIYLYLQSNEIGMREEILIFFNHCCRPLERAQKHFQFIVEHYPWTNRNKYYMLSCILSLHDFEYLRPSEAFNSEDFFKGMRLSLSYKYLLPASQYLVKALSKRDSLYLLELSASILSNGSLKEIQNFSAHWFPRIDQKLPLFHLVYERLEHEDIFSAQSSPDEGHRLIIIFTMNSRYIIELSKLTFFRVSTELITNCFNYENDAQLLIYKFIAENMSFFALEDCLDFLLSFIRHHKGVENAQMRNTILGKIPTIINYISRTYFKVQKHTTESSLITLEDSIGNFFAELHQIILNDIIRDIYQPKIFALKLLDIFLKSLYQEQLQKNAKNCNLVQNERLGALLIAQHVFDASQATEVLVEALDDPQCYDDALELIVDIINRLGNVEHQCVLNSCQKCCQSVDIDKCALSPYYAKVALTRQDESNSYISTLYTFAFEKLQKLITPFRKDPLVTCKQKSHIFGYLETINVVLQASTFNFVASNYAGLLDLLENIESIILEFLNTSDSCKEQVFAASFQDMDENLETLVAKSEISCPNHEESRKFLLMAFWLTLKACCDVSSTLGCHLASQYAQSQGADSMQEETFVKDLRRCLDLIVSVLIRCRHKGAIESAGLSIGKLTKYLTSKNNQLTVDINELLCECLSVVFENKNDVSTTRRGAGYSIMLLHVIKNDSQWGRPLLKHAVARIFEILDQETSLSSSSLSSKSQKSNCDRIEVLALHYLCVLVKDAEIRNNIFSYYNDIMLAAIAKIDDPEWTICNAALQLFGAVVPKVVGQRQATELDESHQDWEPTQVTYAEIFFHMRKTIYKILKYCKDQANRSTSTRSIILLLGFLSKIEHLPQDTKENVEGLYTLNEQMWTFLQHPCEKVRKLAAACFVRGQDIRCQLPHALLLITDLLFQVRNENFFQGLVFVLCEGIVKIRNEALYTIPFEELNQFNQTLRDNLLRNAKFGNKFKSYTHVKFLHLLEIVGLHDNPRLMIALVDNVNLNAKDTKLSIGHEEWCEYIAKLRI